MSRQTYTPEEMDLSLGLARGEGEKGAEGYGVGRNLSALDLSKLAEAEEGQLTAHALDTRQNASSRGFLWVSRSSEPYCDSRAATACPRTCI